MPRFHRGRSVGVPASTLPWNAKSSSTSAFVRYVPYASTTRQRKYVFHVSSGTASISLAKPCTYDGCATTSAEPFPSRRVSWSQRFHANPGLVASSLPYATLLYV